MGVATTQSDHPPESGPAPGLRLSHVRAAPCAGQLADRRLLFLHVPKAAGTTLDYILAALADETGAGFRRIPGTLYGQYLGPAKAETVAALDALGEPPFARARFVTGHLPHRPPDAFDGADPAPVTLLRDPVARMLSHYRYGVERGGWTEDASLARLVEDGRLCNNLQTRQLAGCLDAREPCDDAMLARAQENLAAHYAVVGQTENFDGFLAALIALFGWPELLYGRRQVTSRRLDPARLAALADEAGHFNRFDARLLAGVRQKGDPWLNRLDPGRPPARPGHALVVAPGLSVERKGHGRVALDALDDFAAAMAPRGVSVAPAGNLGLTAGP